ncbi:MAG: hypothetical protein JJU02_14615 [Cryomorphaceae bacterium]|nr:hypothetical protein [Cryomorphaceae bacterium]
MNFWIWIPLVLSLGVLNIILLYLLTKSSQKSISASEENGFFQLKMNKAYLFLGYGLIALGGLFAAVGLVKKGTEIDTLIIISCVFLFFLLLGFWIIVYFKRHFVEFNADKILIHNSFRKTQAINWDELSLIKLNHFINTYRLVCKDKKTYSINQQLIGISGLIHIAKGKAIKT